METVEGLRDGLRERKKERTRDAIRDEARDLFLERGFPGTTIDDIAAAADVSPRTFFRYFASKEEVLFSRFDETLELLRAFLEDRPADEGVGAALRAASAEFASMGSTVSGDRAMFDLMRSTEALHARYLESFFRLESIAAEWIARRTQRSPEDGLPRTLAAVLAAGARVSLDVWSDQPEARLQDLLELPLAMIDSALQDEGPERG